MVQNFQIKGSRTIFLAKQFNHSKGKELDMHLFNIFAHSFVIKIVQCNKYMYLSCFFFQTCCQHNLYKLSPQYFCVLSTIAQVMRKNEFETLGILIFDVSIVKDLRLIPEGENMSI